MLVTKGETEKMKLLIFVCFILAGIVMIPVVKIGNTQSWIGEEGRKTVRAIGMRALVGGALLFVGSGTGIIDSQILRSEDAWSELSILLYTILGVGILVAGVGGCALKRTKLEKETELVVTTLTNCIIMCKVASRSMDYYVIMGVSLEGRQSTFSFHGTDREMIEQAQKMGKKNFVIRYYKSSGRIYDVMSPTEAERG
ncbi:MAG: hypothetical protein K2H34_06040 [Lachnospiraceae bacterium]|nr:hypothetical protein [Lachnospiraceae bacterium]